MICYRTFTNKNKNDTMLSHIKKIGTQMTQIELIHADKCINNILQLPLIPKGLHVYSNVLPQKVLPRG